jgi:hypothetical protein
MYCVSVTSNLQSAIGLAVGLATSDGQRGASDEWRVVSFKLPEGIAGCSEREADLLLCEMAFANYQTYRCSYKTSGSGHPPVVPSVLSVECCGCWAHLLLWVVA